MKNLVSVVLCAAVVSAVCADSVPYAEYTNLVARVNALEAKESARDAKRAELMAKRRAVAQKRDERRPGEFKAFNLKGEKRKDPKTGKPIVDGGLK